MILNRRCFCAPNPARILEEPHQLLLLGVHTDNKKFFVNEELALPVDIIELAVAIRTVGTGEAFAIGAQSVAQLVEQIPDGIDRNANVHRLQLVADVLKALAGTHPLSSHRVTGCAIAKELSQHAQDLRRFFLVCGRPPPARRIPSRCTWPLRISRRPRATVSASSPNNSAMRRSPPCPCSRLSSPA